MRSGSSCSDPVQIPLVAIKKYQVVRKRVQNMYVAFSDFNTGLRTRVAERVTDGSPVDREGRRFGGVPPTSAPGRTGERDRLHPQADSRSRSRR